MSVPLVRTFSFLAENMWRVRQLFILLFLSICFTGKAQLTDSIAASLKHTPKFTAFFDTRNSFINSQFIKMRGVKAGLSFNRTSTFAIGYNWMQGDIRKEVEVDEPQGFRRYKADLNLWYISGYFEYAFYKSRYWEASIPIQLGVGKSWYRYETDDGEVIDFDEGNVVFYEANMTLIYKPIKYIGLGGGIGYRLSLYKPKAIDTRFTAPLYTLRFNVYFGEIFKDVFRRKGASNRFPD